MTGSCCGRGCWRSRMWLVGYNSLSGLFPSLSRSLQVVRCFNRLFSLSCLVGSSKNNNGLRHFLLLSCLLDLRLGVVWSKLLLPIVVRVEHILLHLRLKITIEKALATDSSTC